MSAHAIKAYEHCAQLAADRARHAKSPEIANAMRAFEGELLDCAAALRRAPGEPDIHEILEVAYD